MKVYIDSVLGAVHQQGCLTLCVGMLVLLDEGDTGHQ